MPGHDPRATLRREALARRRALVAGMDCGERAQTQARAAAHAWGWIAARVPTPGVAGLTRALGAELDPAPLTALLERAGWRIALPRVHGQGPMSFHDGSGARVHPALVVAPLVAFDARGARLGRGGGHYDRTLAALRRAGPVAVLGLAWDEQEVSRLPAMAWDEPLEAIATPARLVVPAVGR